MTRSSSQPISRPVRQTCAMAILALFLLQPMLVPVGAGAAEEPVPPKGSLAADTLDHLLKSKGYREFDAMYLELRRLDPAWARSELGIAAEAKLRMIRDDARAAAVVKTDYSTPALQYAVGGLRIMNESVRTGDLATDLPYRARVIDDVVVNLLHGSEFGEVRKRLAREYSRRTGKIPSLSLQSVAQESSEKGIAAAKAGDWKGAVDHFQDARRIEPYAPQLMFNLGTAESNLPGHELRSLAWFKAYLLAVPKAANAAAVRDQVARLESGFVTKMRKIIDSLQGLVEAREGQPLESYYKPETAQALRSLLRSTEWDLEAARYFLGDVERAGERVRRLFGDGWAEKGVQDRADGEFMAAILSGQPVKDPPLADPDDYLAKWATGDRDSDIDLNAYFTTLGINKTELSQNWIFGLQGAALVTKKLVREYARLHGITEK